MQTQERKWYPCSLHKGAAVDVVNTMRVVPVKSRAGITCGDGKGDCS